MRLSCILAIVYTAQASLAPAALSPLALSGDEVPGIPDAKFDYFTLGSLNTNGEATFLATLQSNLGGVTPNNDKVLYTSSGGSLTLLARSGWGAVPEVNNANFETFLDISTADNGDVIVRADLAAGVGGVTTRIDQGLWRYSAGGNELVAREAVGEAPGVSGGFFNSIPNFLRTTENGDLAFSGQLIPGGGVTSLNDSGIWFYQGATGTLIVREGISPVPGVPGQTFNSLGKPSINNNTQGTARGTFNMNTTSGVWRYTGTSGELLARQGVGLAPGTASSFSSFQDPVINETGLVAFRAETVAGQEGLWRYNGPTGELAAISGTGSVPEVAGASFGTFSNPHLTDTGRLLVSATLNHGNGGVTPQNDLGIWSFSSASDELLLRTGSGDVPGISGASFAGFEELAVNAGGSAVVLATLAVGSGGVDATNDQGLWLLPATGSAQLIARKGDQLAGRTISALSLLSEEFVGRPARGFNNQDQLLFQTEFTNGDEGLFLFTAGSLANADFNTDTSVDAIDLGIWQAAYSTTDCGDADGDGDSDGADFLAWQFQYTGPGPLSSNTAVPEPDFLAFSMILTTLMTAQRRLG